MVETIVTAIVGCLCGNIMMFLLLPQKRKMADLENENKTIENEVRQSDEWRKLYEEAHSECKELSGKIDLLYAEIKEHRDEKAEQSVEITELKVDNTRLKILKCERPSCNLRLPPTGF